MEHLSPEAQQAVQGAGPAHVEGNEESSQSPPCGSQMSSASQATLLRDHGQGPGGQMRTFRCRCAGGFPDFPDLEAAELGLGLTLT